MHLDRSLSKTGDSSPNLAGTHAENPAPPQKRTQPLKVHVVDDEPLIRWSVRRGLTKRGHKPFQVTDLIRVVETV
jgi:hypothetical protein